MKNILTINADTYNYMLLSNMDNGENSVVLDITADVSKNPILEIDGTTVAITSTDFEYVIPESMYVGTGVLQFRFVNDDHTGDYFQIAKVAAVDGNLYLKRISDLSYSLSCAKSSALDKQAIVDMIYPVGSIYISVNSTSPATLFGGTWERIKDRFLLSAGDAYSAGATGGAATVKLTAAQSGVPVHSHDLNSHKHSLGDHKHSVPKAQAYVQGSSGVGRKRVASGSAYYTIASSNANDMVYGTETNAASGSTGASSGSTANNTAAAASQAHNNMPPYLAVYMWKRTA